jgi:hypothetical protein
MSESARKNELYQRNKYARDNESPYNRKTDALLDSEEDEEEEDLFKRRESENT